MKTNILKWAGLGVMALVLTGCPPKKQVKTEEETKIEETKSPTEEPSLRGKDYKEVPELVVVYFELDQSSLTPGARSTLQKNAQAIKANPDWEILVEGHCDERGTTEYNLGLGQRRAASVRQYYISLGVPGTRVATISYGKESPSCSASTEDCWSKNRRGVSKARVTEKQEAK